MNERLVLRRRLHEQLDCFQSSRMLLIALDSLSTRQRLLAVGSAGNRKCRDVSMSSILITDH